MRGIVDEGVSDVATSVHGVLSRFHRRFRLVVKQRPPRRESVCVAGPTSVQPVVGKMYTPGINDAM